MRSKNLILFVIVLCLGALFAIFSKDTLNKISLEVLDLFPQTQEREMIELYQKFGDSKVIYIAKSENVSDKAFDEFLTQLQKLPNIAEIIRGAKPNKALKNYIRSHYFLMGDLVVPKYTKQQIIPMISSAYVDETLNPIDPLGMIRFPKMEREFVIDGMPYVIVQMKSADALEVDKLYEEFVVLAQKYEIKHYFSSLFMSVKNPQLALGEVNFLMGIAGVLFAILYFLILRMPFLTLNSIATIIFSNIIAILVLLWIYPQVSIISLSFGIGISNICIDYMMHHHFLGFYTDRKIRFNPSVFYGFITSFVGFGICLFVPFPLLNQLALYAMINLGVAYLVFAFLYQNITFPKPHYYEVIGKFGFNHIPSYIFLSLALGLGGYGALHTKADLDLSKLDYQNKPMNEQKEFFASIDNAKPFLMSASSLNALIAKSKEVRNADIEIDLALSLFPTYAEVKKRERYFRSLTFQEEIKELNRAVFELKKEYPEIGMLSSSYKRPLPSYERLSVEKLAEFGIDVIKYKGKYYTQARSSHLSKLAQIDGVYTKQVEDLMGEITGGIYMPMMSILVLALVAMVILLLLSTKRNFINALSFVIFPIACVLFYLSLTSSLNIMHLFAMLIVVVVGVDYGIYHTQERKDIGAKHAILFSTLTTLCSFGLFLFSQTRALNSFGEVIVIGMGCILLLVFLQKDMFNSPKRANQ